MHPYDRFEQKDRESKVIIQALQYKPEIKPAIQPERIKDIQDKIEDLTDQICNLIDECGLSAEVNIKLFTNCRGCGQRMFIDNLGSNNPEAYDHSYSYCGKNQFCMP